MKILNTLWPILLALAVGVGVGRLLPERLIRRLVGLITPLIRWMLFLIGREFGAVLVSSGMVGPVLRQAALYALATTLLPAVMILLVLRWRRGVWFGRREVAGLPLAVPAGQGRRGGTLRRRLVFAWPPLREVLIALGMVGLGGLFHLMQRHVGLEGLSMPSGATFLLVLLVMVGADLARVRVTRAWLSVALLAVPALVVLGSWMAGALVAWVLGEPVRQGLALSSGFGWFSLSSVMVGEALGERYGTLALGVDLFRELLGITLMYAVGQRLPQIAIAAGGSTTLDSTLPILRQTCPPSAIALALANGFLLTLLAPLLMSLFLA